MNSFLYLTMLGCLKFSIHRAWHTREHTNIRINTHTHEHTHTQSCDKWTVSTEFQWGHGPDLIQGLIGSSLIQTLHLSGREHTFVMATRYCCTFSTFYIFYILYFKLLPQRALLHLLQSQLHTRYPVSHQHCRPKITRTESVLNLQDTQINCRLLEAISWAVAPRNHVCAVQCLLTPLMFSSTIGSYLPN